MKRILLVSILINGVYTFSIAQNTSDSMPVAVPHQMDTASVKKMNQSESNMPVVAPEQIPSSPNSPSNPPPEKSKTRSKKAYSRNKYKSKEKI